MLKRIALLTVIACTASAPDTALAGEAGAPPAALTAEIAQWLTEKFELPPAGALPRIALVPQPEIAAMRYRGLSTPPRPDAASTLAQQGRYIVAVYDDTSATVYLPDDWQPDSLADQSVLVHEMVHHLQSQAKMKFECAQAREKLAYRAQSAWLERAGSSLESEFGLDGFSLLVHTNCMM